MSFWTRIGLADKNTIIQLQEEIKSLNEENNRLEQEKNALLKQLIEEQTGKIVLAIKDSKEEVMHEAANQCNELVALYNRLENILNHELGEVTKKLQDMEANAQDRTLQINDSISKIVDSSETKLKDEIIICKKQIANVTDNISLYRNESKDAFSESGEKLEQLTSIGKVLQANVAGVDDVRAVNEAIIHLWKILKIVFVDSMLNEIEKTV